MGKRGPKPKGRVKIRWSGQFAYAIGLLASDGCLSPNGRHVILVSKDGEQLKNFMEALGVKIKIGYIRSGYTRKKTARIQFGELLPCSKKIEDRANVGYSRRAFVDAQVLKLVDISA